MSSFIAMCLFALVSSLSPGPVNIVATSSGANFGFQKTLPHIAGATIGFTSILILLGLGMMRVFSGNPDIAHYLSYAGAGFLLYMSYRIASAPMSISADERQVNPPALFEGLLCQWLNPKAWIVAVAGVTMFSVDGEADFSVIAQLSVTFFVICFLSISVWAAAGVGIQKLLYNPRHYRIFNLSMGGLLATTVVYLLIPQGLSALIY